MNQLKVVSTNGRLVTDSRDVAKMLDRGHNGLMKSIRSYIHHLTNGKLPISEFFIESQYEDNNNQTRPCFLLTRKGCDMLISRTKFSNGLIRLIDAVNKEFESNYKTIVINSRFEESFIKNLQETLIALELTLEVQKCVLEYRLDGYIPELNIAVEYDEAQHSISSNKAYDFKREKLISRHIGCEFVRCDYKNSDSYNIGVVMKKVLEVQNAKLTNI